MAKTQVGGQARGAMQLALERLRVMIVLGELLPGEQIRQQEMAESLGVSRVPLREAMNVLSDQGLLVHRRNQGYFVARSLPGEVIQIRRMLYLLENELLSTLRWPEPAALAELHDINQQIAMAVAAQDLTRISELNAQFHHALLALSPHTLILNEVMRLWTRLDPVFTAKLTRPEYVQRMVEEHRAILEQLERRDAAALMHAMNQHRYGRKAAPTLTDGLN